MRLTPTLKLLSRPCGRPGVSTGLGLGLTTVPLVLWSEALAHRKFHPNQSVFYADYFMALVFVLLYSVGSFGLHCALLQKFHSLRRTLGRLVVTHVFITTAFYHVWSMYPPVDLNPAAFLLFHELWYSFAVGLAYGLPYTFTYGETLCFSAGLALTVGDLVLLGMPALFGNTTIVPNRPLQNTLIEVGIIAPVAIGALCWALTFTKIVGTSSGHRKYGFTKLLGFLASVAMVTGMALGYLWQVYRENPLRWTWEFVTGSSVHLQIVLYWCLCLAAIMGTIRIINVPHNPPASSPFRRNLLRKFYHLAVVVMFTPAYIAAPRFLSLAMAVGWGGMALLEVARVMGVEWLAPRIEQFMRPFTDHHDAGPLIVSHLYLMVGCALPIWLHSPLALSNLAGVLTLGVGDAMASIVGQWLGRYRWPGAKKTIEGTIAFAASVYLAAALLSFLNLVTSPSVRVLWFPPEWNLPVLVSSTLTAGLEALTDQNDNLYIPLAFSVMLNLTCALF
ncbi:hypothetical protein IWQ62_000607 [Dispira parvispora]|uniref:dolichol kinase n=1 Tax=Dispira parvispora TaxID=1520584 RepID=A0A9W8E9Z7_9FUNG|nr:hypothetical protein IWQ62_000607 [Dispira parvispora]